MMGCTRNIPTATSSFASQQCSNDWAPMAILALTLIVINALTQSNRCLIVPTAPVDLPVTRTVNATMTNIAMMWPPPPPPPAPVDSAQALLAQPLNWSRAVLHQPASTVAQCESTLVTCYFNVRSKHSSDSYKNWMRNMMSLQDCMVIYIQPDWVAPMLQLRAELAPANRTIVVEMNLTDVPIASMHALRDPNFWPRQLDIDPEKRIHRSYQLFWIWLSKSWLVQQAIAANYFDSSIFVYSDVGIMRSDAIAKSFWRQPMITQTHLVPRDEMLWYAHSTPNAPPTYLWNNKSQTQYFFQVGGLAASYAAPWQQFHARFAAMLDEFVAHDLFIGEDQCVLQGTCQKHHALCVYVPSSQVRDNQYFGMRLVLRLGGNFTYWRFPPFNTTSNHSNAASSPSHGAAVATL